MRKYASWTHRQGPRRRSHTPFATAARAGPQTNTTGNQADLHRLYVGRTRARRSTTVWLEKEPFGAPGDRAARVAKSTHASDAEAQSLFNRMLDAIEELESPSEDMDTDILYAALPPRVAQYAGPLAADAERLALFRYVLNGADNAWDGSGHSFCPQHVRRVEELG